MIRLSREEFEAIAEETFAHLPATFRDRVDNVVIVVQDYPAEEDLRAARIRSKHHLLGLYSGISYPHRSVWYGMSPVTPDVIKLFQRNIEDLCTDLEELKGKIAEVLLHELGHYFGMSEEEIRRAQRE